MIQARVINKISHYIVIPGLRSLSVSKRRGHLIRY